jgi:hypothetical protein
LGLDRYSGDSLSDGQDGETHPAFSKGIDMEIIIKGKHDHFGKTRSEQETNMRKEWGQTMSDEQLDKLKFLERKAKDKTGTRKNFTKLNYVDEVK